MIPMENLFIIIGLGNPGNNYNNTRHNAGFDTIDFLSRERGIDVRKLKFKALSGEGRIGDSRVLLVKPQTFMNSSGESVRDIMEWYKIPYSNLIIIYDDVDLPVGKIRIRPKGSAGTHNGMRSVLYHTCSDEFPRVKIGIGQPPENWDIIDYVLGRFTDEERKIMDETIKTAAAAVAGIITTGVDAAMNRYNV